MPIRRLPPLLVNQIAAGEVIERPASVVKECAENAIDAGARRIDIAVEAGGRELIRITDDGCGIPMVDLPLALAPHATSKISEQADLDAIATLGFRGEALASIASVSRLSILSRPAEQSEAAIIEADPRGPGRTTEPRPAGGPVGTTVTVRTLFFNTPARRKFLRTDQTEAGRVSDIVHALALAHPAIGFSLRIDRRTALDLPPDQASRRRVLDVLGGELEEQLLEFSAAERGIDLWGMAGRPDIARGTPRSQHVFLNGRLISDRSIMHAIREAYRGLIEPGRYPTLVLFLSMDPAQVDVNVHPAKAEVRFRNQASVHGAVLSTIRNALRGADLTPAFDLNGPAAAFRHAAGGGADQGTPNTMHRVWGPRAVPLPPMPAFGSGRSAPGSGGGPSPPSFAEFFRKLDPVQKGFIYSEVKQAMAQDDAAGAGPGAEPGAERAAREDDSELRTPNAGPLTLRAAGDVLQVHSSYLVTEDRDGLLIIDQHALHERVMFEKLRQRIEAGPLESQRLLMPATVDVPRSQVEMLPELQPLLAKLGIDAEPIGPGAIAVHAFTGLLFERNVAPARFMADLLNRAENDGLPGEPEAAIHEVLDMMACKAAVKAGDHLSREELIELLSHRETVERSSNCPHGRPTSLRLTLRDLERQFGRS